MEDIVSYIPPFGLLGKIANKVYIKHMLTKIFEYRFEKIDCIFKEMHPSSHINKKSVVVLK